MDSQTWRSESDPATLSALYEIYRGLKDGNRDAIASGFDRLGSATGSSFWMFDGTWRAWPGDETVQDSLIVANPIANEWLHFEPASRVARRMGGAGKNAQGERQRPRAVDLH
jgi:hypothetical protein